CEGLWLKKQRTNRADMEHCLNSYAKTYRRFTFHNSRLGICAGASILCLRDGEVLIEASTGCIYHSENGTYLAPDHQVSPQTASENGYGHHRISMR
ncbi:hypothetical protein R0K18_26825, partial [Pantoea sp. SIMBA_133]